MDALPFKGWVGSTSTTAQTASSAAPCSLVPEVAGLRLSGGVAAGGEDMEELKVTHGGDEGVSDITGLAHRVEVDAELALGRGVHGAGKWKAAAVELQRGMYCSMVSVTMSWMYLVSGNTLRMMPYQDSLTHSASTVLVRSTRSTAAPSVPAQPIERMSL
jgi:hypothetical protein